jgi:hypothetical protein
MSVTVAAYLSAVQRATDSEDEERGGRRVGVVRDVLQAAARYLHKMDNCKAAIQPAADAIHTLVSDIQASLQHALGHSTAHDVIKQHPTSTDDGCCAETVTSAASVLEVDCSAIASSAAVAGTRSRLYNSHSVDDLLPTEHDLLLCTKLDRQQRRESDTKFLEDLWRRHTPAACGCDQSKDSDVDCMECLGTLDNFYTRPVYDDVIDYTIPLSYLALDSDVINLSRDKETSDSIGDSRMSAYKFNEENIFDSGMTLSTPIAIRNSPASDLSLIAPTVNTKKSSLMCADITCKCMSTPTSKNTFCLNTSAYGQQGSGGFKSVQRCYNSCRNECNDVTDDDSNDLGMLAVNKQPVSDLQRNWRRLRHTYDLLHPREDCERRGRQYVTSFLSSHDKSRRNEMGEWMEAKHRVQLRQYLDERTHRVQAEAHPFISSARASVDDVIPLSDVCKSGLRTFRRELQRDNWRVLRVREGARVMCELLEEESRCWSLRQAARLTNRE